MTKDLVWTSLLFFLFKETLVLDLPDSDDLSNVFSFMKKNLTSNFIYTRSQKMNTQRHYESGQVAFTHICTCDEKLVLINQRKRMRLCSLRKKKKTAIVSFVPIMAIIKYRVFFLNAKSFGTFSRRMITLTLLFPCLLHTQPWNTLEYYCSLQWKPLHGGTSFIQKKTSRGIRTIILPRSIRDE